MSDTRKAIYRDPERGIEERVADLLGRMTLDEKIAQLGAVFAETILDGDAFSPSKAKERLRHGSGQITRIGGSTLLGPRETASIANDVQRFLRDETRLSVPTMIHEESCAGYLARGATQFPQAIGLASTWDPELVEQIGGVIREQMLAVGARQTLAPLLDIARDARWGRCEETYGEDPYLASRLGVAYVRGVQGEDLSRGVVATGKHFMGYGASEGGLNWAPCQLPRRELLERILPPFEAAIREAGLASIMNGYEEIDGVPCGASKWLLTELLRDELGFEGVVVADYYTVICLMGYHRVAADKAEAGARARRSPRVASTRRWWTAPRPAFCARSSSWACSSIPSSTPRRRRRSSTRRRSASWRDARRSARWCCCRTGVACCRSTPASAGWP
jgi:beta-glucosidase